jgi:5-methylcytosine-specific restriction enzyme subunit McrC
MDNAWIELIEYKPTYISDKILSLEFGEYLWLKYNKEINIEFPSPKTNNCFELTSKGWVGYIPVNNDFGLYIKPRITISKLFAMLEYAYNLKSFKFIDGIIECETVLDLYDRIVSLLIKLVNDRLRKGLYREYVEQKEVLSYLSGNMDINYKLINPNKIKFLCSYQDIVTDIGDNRIITWTLYRIIKMGLCNENTIRLARKTFRNLIGQTDVVPFKSVQCLGRNYNRLNEDYKIIHSLCKLVLDQEGPIHSLGNQKILPFLVDMAKLFEIFISKWLNKWIDVYYPNIYELKSQENVVIDENGNYKFKIDLVIYNKINGITKCVMDTKYKISEKPTTQDISQIVTYAVLKDCKEAILIYPTQNIKLFDERIKDIRVRSIGFPLDLNFDELGEEFLLNLLCR